MSINSDLYWPMLLHASCRAEAKGLNSKKAISCRNKTLLDMGKAYIYVLEISPDQIHETDQKDLFKFSVRLPIAIWA